MSKDECPAGGGHAGTVRPPRVGEPRLSGSRIGDQDLGRGGQAVTGGLGLGQDDLVDLAKGRRERPGEPGIAPRGPSRCDGHPDEVGHDLADRRRCRGRIRGGRRCGCWRWCRRGSRCRRRRCRRLGRGNRCRDRGGNWWGCDRRRRRDGRNARRLRKLGSGGRRIRAAVRFMAAAGPRIGNRIVRGCRRPVARARCRRRFTRGRGRFRCSRRSITGRWRGSAHSGDARHAGRGRRGDDAFDTTRRQEEGSVGQADQRDCQPDRRGGDRQAGPRQSPVPQRSPGPACRANAGCRTGRGGGRWDSMATPGTRPSGGCPASVAGEQATRPTRIEPDADEVGDRAHQIAAAFAEREWRTAGWGPDTRRYGGARQSERRSNTGAGRPGPQRRSRCRTRLHRSAIRQRLGQRSCPRARRRRRASSASIRDGACRCASATTSIATGSIRPLHDRRRRSPSLPSALSRRAARSGRCTPRSRASVARSRCSSTATRS